MRTLTVLLVCLAASCGGRSTKVKEFVSDQEHVLTPSQHRRLDSLFLAHEQRTGNEIALVTHPTFDQKTPVEFAVAFGESVGIGKKERDNGVVIAFSNARRSVFIATGYGTERVLHDSICRRIIDQEMLPRFKADSTFQGLWSGSRAVVDFLDRPENVIR